MIRGVDITKLLTAGDQTSLRLESQKTRRSLGSDSYRINQINAAIAADPASSVSKDTTTRAKKVLGSAIDEIYSRNRKADSSKPSSSVREGDSFTQAVDDLGRFMTKNVMGESSISLTCNVYILPASSQAVTCHGLVGNGVVPLTCDALIAASNLVGLIGTLTCDATVQASTFQIIDYRWADNVASNPWKNPADPKSFYNDNIEFDTIVYLAIRVRLSGSVTLTGNDWTLYWAEEGQEAEDGGGGQLPWQQVSTNSDIFRLYTPSSGRLTSTASLNKANAVTRPGPGNPELYEYIIIAQTGAQSPAIDSQNVNSNTEIEVWYPLYLKSPLLGLPPGSESKVYFKLESSSLLTTGLNVVGGNATTSSHWWQAAILYN